MTKRQEAKDRGSGGAEEASVAKPYEPTAREREALAAHRVRKQGRKPAPGLKVLGKKGQNQLELNHPDLGIGWSLLMEAIGTPYGDFVDGLLKQLANAAAEGRELDERALNFMIAVVRDVEPRDQLEAMLAAQMAAIHNATMTFARRLNTVETIPQQDSAERAFTRLARTFATQMEALKRYRTGGEQRVVVEHVTVNEGGKAMVGSFATGGRGSGEK